MARRKASALHVLTANHLLTGDVVYLAADGRWTRSLDEARLAASPGEVEALERFGTGPEVEAETTGGYVIPVERDERGALRPLQLRELLRTRGPSIATPFGARRERQAQGDDHVSL